MYVYDEVPFLSRFPKVAKGSVTKDAVVARTIRIFERKMYHFAMRIDKAWRTGEGG